MTEIEVSPEQLARELGQSGYAPDQIGNDETKQAAGEEQTAPEEADGNTPTVTLRRSPRVPNAKVRQIPGAIKYV